jgi:hypothetical protein
MPHPSTLSTSHATPEGPPSAREKPAACTSVGRTAAVTTAGLRVRHGLGLPRAGCARTGEHPHGQQRVRQRGAVGERRGAEQQRRRARPPHPHRANHPEGPQGLFGHRRGHPTALRAQDHQPARRGDAHGAPHRRRPQGQRTRGHGGPGEEGAGLGDEAFGVGHREAHEGVVGAGGHGGLALALVEGHHRGAQLGVGEIRGHGAERDAVRDPAQHANAGRGGRPNVLGEGREGREREGESEGEGRRAHGPTSPRPAVRDQQSARNRRAFAPPRAWRGVRRRCCADRETSPRVPPAAARSSPRRTLKCRHELVPLDRRVSAAARLPRGRRGAACAAWARVPRGERAHGRRDRSPAARSSERPRRPAPARPARDPARTRGTAQRAERRRRTPRGGR